VEDTAEGSPPAFSDELLVKTVRSDDESNEDTAGAQFGGTGSDADSAMASQED
jgi:hypothetical protein